MNCFQLIFTLIFVLQKLNAYPSPLGITSPNNADFERDPEEIGGGFEGDMWLDKNQVSALYRWETRNGLIDDRYRWPNNIVYYALDSAFDNEHAEHIVNSLKIIEDSTCLRFLPSKSFTDDHVYVTSNPTGCHSKVGYQSGRQTLNLQIYPIGSGCFRTGTIIHEFIHAIGFFHQQSSADRDNYVKIIEENVQDGKLHNFNKYSEDVVTDYDIGYDYDSVMHYGPKAFSKNGEHTIVPFDESAKIGQRVRISESDIKKINLMYNC